MRHVVRRPRPKLSSGTFVVDEDNLHLPDGSPADRAARISPGRSLIPDGRRRLPRGDRNWAGPRSLDQVMVPAMWGRPELADDHARYETASRRVHPPGRARTPGPGSVRPRPSFQPGAAPNEAEPDEDRIQDRGQVQAPSQIEPHVDHVGRRSRDIPILETLAVEEPLPLQGSANRRERIQGRRRVSNAPRTRG